MAATAAAAAAGSAAAAAPPAAAAVPSSLAGSGALSVALAVDFFILGTEVHILGRCARPAAAAAAAAADAEAPKRRGGSAGGVSLHHDPLKQVTQLAGVEAKQSGGIASGVLHAYFRAFGWRLLGW